jgi:MFS family permease
MSQRSPATTTAKSHGFFYGWVIVVAAAIKGAFMVGGAQFASSVFLVPMQGELGWSRTVLFGALSVRGIVAGMLQPFVGPLGDHRWWPRVVLPVGAVLMGLSFMALRWVQSPIVFYLWYGLVGAIGMTFISNAITDAVVFKWFIRKRPQVVMWVNQGPGVAPLLFPVTLTALIGAVGWRDAWLWFGLGTIAILLPLALMVRTRPEDMGLTPDGEPARPAHRPGGAGVRSVDEHSYTRSEAIRTRSFWTLSLAMAFGIFGIPGFQAHWIPYFLDLGFSAEIGATVVFVFGMFGVTSRFLWAILSARFDVRWVFMGQALAAAAAAALALQINNIVLLFVWAAGAGLVLVGFFQLQALIAVNYFGRGHIGAVRGVMWPLSTASSSAAPFVIGALRDAQGSYNGAFTLVSVTWLLCAFFVFLSRPLKEG